MFEATQIEGVPAVLVPMKASELGQILIYWRTIQEAMDPGVYGVILEPVKDRLVSALHQSEAELTAWSRRDR